MFDRDFCANRPDRDPLSKTNRFCDIDSSQFHRGQRIHGDGQRARPLHRETGTPELSATWLNRRSAVDSNLPAAFDRQAPIAQNYSTKLYQVRSIGAANHLVFHCIPRHRRNRGADRGHIGDGDEPLAAVTAYTKGCIISWVSAATPTATIISAISAITSAAGIKIAPTTTAAP